MGSGLTVRHQGSYYENSSCLYPAISPLQKDLDVDVAIVGGGITGLSTALQLSQSGLSTVVLESDTFASVPPAAAVDSCYWVSTNLRKFWPSSMVQTVHSSFGHCLAQH